MKEIRPIPNRIPESHHFEEQLQIGRQSSRQNRRLQSPGNFEDVQLKISGFYPTRFFRQFWADPIFSAVRSTFLAEEEAQNLEFYPTRNFGHFWAPSLVTLLIFRNVMTREHLNTLNTLNT